MFKTLNLNNKHLIDILGDSSLCFYDSEFIRIRQEQKDVFELIQMGIINNQKKLNIKIKHNIEIPLREQILLGINKDGYMKNGVSFAIALSSLKHFIEQYGISYIVAFAYGEDIEVLLHECNKNNIPIPSFMNNFLDISQIIKNHYNIKFDISLLNICYLFGIDKDKRFRKNSHDALADAINTGLITEYFLKNLDNNIFSKEYIEGFIFGLIKFRKFNENNIKSTRTSVLYKNRGLPLKNSLFKNSSKNIMKYMIINSIPDETKNNKMFKDGLYAALDKIIHSE